MPSLTDIFLTPLELSARWGGAITEKTLANWRTARKQKSGPPHVRIGGRILYRLEDVEAYERRAPGNLIWSATPGPAAPAPNGRRSGGRGSGGPGKPPCHMTPAEFIACGEVIYGERWHKPLAREIDRSSKQVRNYASGHTPIPQQIAERVRALADLGREGEAIKAAILKRLPRTKLMTAHVIAREAAEEIRGLRS